MVITSPPDSPQSSHHIPPNLANSKSPHDPNASKFLSKLHSVLKNLKPTQESIHTNSKWFLQATAAQNTSLIKPAASLWKSCWDECRGDKSAEARLNLLYFVNDVLQFGKRTSNLYEKHFSNYVFRILYDILKNKDELKKIGKNVAKIIDIWVTRLVFTSKNSQQINDIAKMYNKNESSLGLTDARDIINSLKERQDKIQTEKSMFVSVTNQKMKIHELTSNGEMDLNAKISQLEDLYDGYNVNLTKIDDSIKFYENTEKIMSKHISNLKIEFDEGNNKIKQCNKCQKGIDEIGNKIRNHISSFPDMSKLGSDEPINL